MASSSFTDEDFSCPVCLGPFKNPVLLMCSHSFCEACVKRSWKSESSRRCPTCRRPSPTEKPPPNLVLRYLCEKFIQQRKAEAEICKLHKERVVFFCRDDKTPMCSICREMDTHSNHKVRQIQKLTKKRKAKLETTLEPIRKKLKTFEEAKLSYEKTGKHIESQARNVERRIKEVLDDFSSLLEWTREEMTGALTMEKLKKSHMVQANIEKINKEISSLTSMVMSAEDAMDSPDATFLQNYQEILKRAQIFPIPAQDPEKLQEGALIDVAKHTGNLTFKVWEKMLSLVTYFPIVLNPNTASRPGILCQDLIELGGPEAEAASTTSSAAADTATAHTASFPDHPERFNFGHTVLGSEGFSSGVHSWDVELWNCTQWSVGVMAESAQRKGDFTSRSGVWCLTYREERLQACCPPDKPVPILGVKDLQNLRVQLDCEKGELSFSRPYTDTQLHTFTHIFTEKVFPLCSGDQLLTIVPGEISVKLHAHY